MTGPKTPIPSRSGQKVFAPAQRPPATELISFSRPWKNPSAKVANPGAPDALGGSCQAGIFIAGPLRPCHIELRETRRAGPIMITKIKYSDVYKSDAAPQNNVAIKDISTDNGSDVGPILQYAYFRVVPVVMRGE
jgi:hypothetical protein